MDVLSLLLLDMAMPYRAVVVSFFQCSIPPLFFHLRVNGNVNSMSRTLRGAWTNQSINQINSDIRVGIQIKRVIQILTY